MDQTGAAQGAHLGLGQPELASPAAAASSATARAWPSVYGDFRSTKFAIAAERSVEAIARRARRRAPAPRRSPHPRSRPRRARPGSPSASLDDQPGQRRVELLAGALARELPGRRRRRRRGTPPRRTRRAARSAPPAGPPRPSARPASPVRPTARRRAPSASSTSVRELELLAQRPRDRGVVGDHPVHLAVARERELEADAEAMQRRIARADPPHPGHGRRARCGTRSRTCRTSARCRRRTTSPARARRSGSRR